MEIKEFKVCKLSIYSLEEGFKEWYEFQPQYDSNMICINLEKINKQENKNE